MEYICILTITIIVYMFILGSYNNYSMGNKLFSSIWKIIILIAFIMAFIFEPNPSLNIDLLRINARLNDITNLGLDKALQYTDIENLYVFRYWLYIISLTNINSLLTAIPFTLDVYIFGKIVSDILGKHQLIKMKYLTMALLIWISLIGLKLAITDIRCVFSMSLCCYALYLEYIKNRNKYFSLSLYILAFFTHHYTIIFILARCILVLMKKTKTKEALLLISFLLILMPNIINLLIPYISNIGEYLIIANQKLMGADKRTYFIYREISQRILYIFMIIVLIYSSLFSYFNQIAYYNRKNISIVFYNANLALFTVSVLLLGFFNTYLVIERGMYIISFLLSITYLLMPSELHKRRTFFFVIPILLYIIFINDINFFVVNKLGYTYLQF